MKFDIAKLLSGKDLKKTIMLKILIVVAPYLLIILILLISVLMVLAPIMSAAEKIETTKNNVAEFFQKVGNLLTLRGFVTDDEAMIKKEQEMYDRIQKHYDEYLEKGKVLIDIPLFLSTIFYPYDAAYDPETVADLASDALLEGGEVDENAYSLKEKKIKELMRNMVTITKNTYDCEWVPDEDGEGGGYKTTLTSSEIFEGKVFPSSTECGNTKVSYFYELDYDKYSTYLKEDYIINSPEFRFPRDLDEITRETRLNSIADDIFDRANLYKNLFGIGTHGTGTGSRYISNVVFTDGALEVKYFNQGDARWKGEPYYYPSGIHPPGTKNAGKPYPAGSKTIGSHGCGQTSVAIVVSSLLPHLNVSPVDVTRYSCPKYCTYYGSYHSLIVAAPEYYGLESIPVSTSQADLQRVIDALSSGSLVIAIMGPGSFTSSGHFIVLRGVTADGDVLVADPNSEIKSKAWPFSLIVEQSRKNTTTPFWIISKIVAE